MDTTNRTVTDMHTTTGMKRLITLQVTIEVDEDRAQQLVGDPGWSSHDGWQRPESGLEMLSHAICEDLSTVSQHSLTAVNGRAVHTSVIISEPYETDSDALM